VAACRAFLDETGLEPTFMAGHSLGEYTALVCADTISFSDAVRIVHLRGKLFQEAVSPNLGLMCSISGVDFAVIKEECEIASREGKVVEVSSYNSPSQTVISGYKEAVSKVAQALEKKNASVIPLKVSAPF